jgi:hypothetical protein
MKLVRIHDDEDFYQELGRLCRLLLDEPRDESDTTIEAMRDQLIEVFTMNLRNSQDYLSAFQDFVGTADENGSSSANMTTLFSAAINLSAGADGLFMTEGFNVFRADSMSRKLEILSV